MPTQTAAKPSRTRSRRQPKIEPKLTAPESTARHYTVRRRTITETIWTVPEGIGGRQEARRFVQEGNIKPAKTEVVAEHWIVEQESKSDVVRRLFDEGLTATEISKLTGWDYSFVYGVSWRDTGGR